jgi:hypothetical protein
VVTRSPWELHLICRQTQVKNIQGSHTDGHARPDFDPVRYEFPSLTIIIFELVELNLIEPCVSIHFEQIAKGSNTGVVRLTLDRLQQHLRLRSDILIMIVINNLEQWGFGGTYT